jgi:hypothetical protein
MIVKGGEDINIMPDTNCSIREILTLFLGERNEEIFYLERCVGSSFLLFSIVIYGE